MYNVSGMEDDDSGSGDSGGEGGRDEHSSDESDDEEAGAVDVDYFTTLLQQGERY